MKRWITSLLAVTLVLAIMATPVFAAGPRQGQHFTDADGDGVCDNSKSCQYVDENQDGICDHRTTRCFVRCLMDREGRAYCCGTAETCPRSGLYQPGNGNQFIDEDGNGVCDNRIENSSDAGACRSRGDGRGRCRGRNQ